MKALRTIPVVRNIAHTMEAVAPGATLINFSNPRAGGTGIAGRSAGASADRAVQCAPSTCRHRRRSVGVSPEALEYGFVGLNHLLYLNSVRQDGRERIGELLQRPLEQMQKNIPDVPADMDFLRQIEALPLRLPQLFLRPPRHAGEMPQGRAMPGGAMHGDRAGTAGALPAA